MKRTASLMLALCSFACAVPGQSWVLTSAPATNWVSLSSSADGMRLVAAAAPASAYTPGLIYISTNGGTNWTETSAPGTNWTSVASSADGLRLVAGVGYYQGPVYTSTNGGETWTVSGAQPTNEWVAVACSSDGLKLLSVAAPRHYIPGEIDVSADGGLSWSTPITWSYENWSSASSSADGQNLAAAAYNSVYFSTNSGATWTNAAVGATSVASSALGRRLLAGTRDQDHTVPAGRLSLSTNFGASWTTTGAPGGDWTGVASSADGTKLVAVGTAAPIYISTDSGSMWSPGDSTNGNWSAVASSADGCRLVAAMNGGGIYIFVAEPRPLLEIGTTSGTTRLSWLVPSTSFVLQQNPDLSTTNWTDVTAKPSLNYTNLNYEVTVAAGAGQMFYRLAAKGQ